MYSPELIVLLVGIAVRVRSTKVLRGHGREIITPIATIYYDNRQKRQ